MFADLVKAAQHKYIKRVPKAGGKGYVYYYSEGSATSAKIKEHMKEGAAFKLTHEGKTGHFHIKALNGERVRVEHDESGASVEMTRDELAALLQREHAKTKTAPAPKAKPEPKREEPKPEPKREEPKPEPEPEPKREEPKPERAKSSDERRVMAFFDHPGAEEAWKRSRVGFKRNLIEREDLQYAYDVESIKTTKQNLPHNAPAGVTPREYAVISQFDTPAFALYEEEGRLIAVAKNGEQAGQSTIITTSRKAPNQRVLIHALASNPQILSQFARVQNTADLMSFKDAVKSIAESPEYYRNIDRYTKAANRDDRRAMAVIAQLMSTHIEQPRTLPIQNTTGEYASNAAIPKSLQAALNSFVYKPSAPNDTAKPDQRAPFRRGGHMYAMSDDRAIRIAVENGPAESGPNADILFENVQKTYKPTATLDASAAKGIAEICRALGESARVEITTLDGKTQFSAGGVLFATIAAHTESAPPQRMNARLLADMLSVENPITILQHPTNPETPLSAHTANTQQLLQRSMYI